MWRKAPPDFKGPRWDPRHTGPPPWLLRGRTDESVAFTWSELQRHRRNNGCAACDYKRLNEKYWEAADYKGIAEKYRCLPQLDLSVAATAPECVECCPEHLEERFGPRPRDEKYRKKVPAEMQHLFCRFE